MEDIITIFSQLLEFIDFVTLATINREFYIYINKNVLYQHHLLLLNENNFTSIQAVSLQPLEYHVNRYLTINNQKMIYYAGLCSKFEFYDLLDKIMADPENKYKCYNNSYLSKPPNTIQQYEIVNNIIKNSRQQRAIEIIKTHYRYSIASSITEHCRIYDILDKCIDKQYIKMLCHYISPLCKSYNDVALEIILKRFPCNTFGDTYVKRIIRGCDNEWWSAEHERFRNLLYNYIKSRG